MLGDESRCLAQRKKHIALIRGLDQALVECSRMSDSQSSEPGFESLFATISKFGHVRSLHAAPVDSAV